MRAFILTALLSSLTFSGPLVSEIKHAPLPDAEERLLQLKCQVDRELELFNFPRIAWTKVRARSDGGHIYDVVIIGGGQTGSTLALALYKEKVTNILVCDENKQGFEGPWLTYARMPMLRSSKCITGPDCGLPSLTCQSWYEAKYGIEQWEEIDEVSRKVWADYLHWVRSVLKLPIANETKVGKIRWDGTENCFVVPTYSKGKEACVYAKKIILATGFQGSGKWSVPQFVSDSLPKTHYSSVYDEIDLRGVKGKKIAVYGCGPSAFDNAILSSTLGAKEVHMFCRRGALANEYVVWPEYIGFLKHFADLPDADKWRFISKMNKLGEPPTIESIQKAEALGNIFIHFNSPWTDLQPRENGTQVSTAHGSDFFDQLLIATGCEIDLSLRDELSGFADRIALWSDRFTPPAGSACPELLKMPYLGPYFEFTEKTPGEAPYLRSIFTCTGGALLSEGLCSSAGVIGMKYSIQKLIYGVTSQLFVEERDYYYNIPSEFNQPQCGGE